MDYIRTIPELEPILRNANHVDVKTVEGDVTLREFVAAMIGYQPAWVTFLYRVRKSFVRLLGMRQAGLPHPPHLTASDLVLKPGADLSFFHIRTAQEDRFMVAEIIDQHLTADLGVVVEPLDGQRKRFHVLTVVHYHNWAGPVYFNIIRPFHHLVVGGMARAGVRPATS